MRKVLKRVLCCALVLCLLFSLTTEAFAATLNSQTAESESPGQNGFDFDASDYSVTEGEKLTITVKRNDAGTDAAIVRFKVADFLSEYGTDYVVLDDKGRELARVEGEKPGADAITEASDTTLFTPAGMDSAVPTASPKGAEAEDSNLLNAANTYLNTLEAPETKAVEDETLNALNELQAFFEKAQGAEGQLNFDKGETEKTITVVPLDNDTADGTRLLMLALTAVACTGGDEAMIAPDATT